MIRFIAAATLFIQLQPPQKLRVPVLDPHQITIISGGQTGADRAALDFAIACGLAHGGWCPRGRLAEDGAIPDRYDLREAQSAGYEQRTRWNVRDSDATLLLTLSPVLQGGTRLTRDVAVRLDRPWMHVSRRQGAGNGEFVPATSIDSGGEPTGPDLRAIGEAIGRFLVEHEVRRLNVAGPRASQEPGIGHFVEEVLGSVFGIGGG